MKLTTDKYAVILTIQTLLLIVDWAANVTTLVTRQNNAIMLILFIVQDVCLILALSILLLTFFSTYVFQTGLVYLLYERFKVTLIVCMAYFVLTTLIHIWTLIVRWNNFKPNWSIAFLLVFILHRFTAALYYYYYKRASLRISDPRFYEDIDVHPTQSEITQ